MTTKCHLTTNKQANQLRDPRHHRLHDLRHLWSSGRGRCQADVALSPLRPSRRIQRPSRFSWRSTGEYFCARLSRATEKRVASPIASLSAVEVIDVSVHKNYNKADECRAALPAVGSRTASIFGLLPAWPGIIARGAAARGGEVVVQLTSSTTWAANARPGTDNGAAQVNPQVAVGAEVMQRGSDLPTPPICASLNFGGAVLVRVVGRRGQKRCGHVLSPANPRKAVGRAASPSVCRSFTSYLASTRRACKLIRASPCAWQAA